MQQNVLWDGELFHYYKQFFAIIYITFKNYLNYINRTFDPACHVLSSRTFRNTLFN
jgi:hypothetical protein